MIYRYTHDKQGWVMYTDPDAPSYFKVVLSKAEVDRACESMVEFMRYCGRDVTLVERLPEPQEYQG